MVRKKENNFLNKWKKHKKTLRTYSDNITYHNINFLYTKL